MKGKTDNSIIIVGDFNITLSVLDRIFRPKINKEREDSYNTINQVDLTDIHRTSTIAEYIVLSGARGTLSRIDKMLGHKASFSNYERVQNMQSMFSDHNGMKLKINKRRKIGKFTSLWKLNSTLFSNKWNESRTHKILCNAVKSVLRGKFMAVNTCKKQEERSQMDNLAFNLNKLEKEEKIQSKQKEGK